MNPKVKTGLAALFAAGLLIPSFAAENPADETTEEIETGIGGIHSYFVIHRTVGL